MLGPSSDTEKSKQPKIEDISMKQLISETWLLIAASVSKWKEVAWPWFLFVSVLWFVGDLLILNGASTMVQLSSMGILQFITAGVAIAWIRHLHLKAPFSLPKHISLNQRTVRYVLQQVMLVIFAYLIVSLLYSVLLISVRNYMLSADVSVLMPDGTSRPFQELTGSNFSEEEFFAIASYMGVYWYLLDILVYPIVLAFLARFMIVLGATALGIEMKFSIAAKATKGQAFKIGGAALIVFLPIFLMMGVFYWGMLKLSFDQMNIVSQGGVLLIMAFLRTFLNFAAMLFGASFIAILWRYLGPKFKVFVFPKKPPKTD